MTSTHPTDTQTLTPTQSPLILDKTNMNAPVGQNSKSTFATPWYLYAIIAMLLLLLIVFGSWYYYKHLLAKTTQSTEPNMFGKKSKFGEKSMFHLEAHHDLHKGISQQPAVTNDDIA